MPYVFGKSVQTSASVEFSSMTVEPGRSDNSFPMQDEKNWKLQMLTLGDSVLWPVTLIAEVVCNILHFMVQYYSINYSVEKSIK